MPNVQAKKIPESRSCRKTSLVLLYSWNYMVGCTRQLHCNTNLQNVWISQKNPHFNQATPNNTCQNFLTQKNPEIENFKPKQILWSSLTLEIWSTPPPPPPPPGLETVKYIVIQLKWWQTAQKWVETETVTKKSTNTINTLDRDMACLSICKTMAFEIHIIQGMYVPLKRWPLLSVLQLSINPLATRAKYTQQPAAISQQPEFIYSRQLKQPGCWYR